VGVVCLGRACSSASHADSRPLTRAVRPRPFPQQKPGFIPTRGPCPPDVASSSRPPDLPIGTDFQDSSTSSRRPPSELLGSPPQRRAPKDSPPERFPNSPPKGRAGWRSKEAVRSLLPDPLSGFLSPSAVSACSTFAALFRAAAVSRLFPFRGFPSQESRAPLGVASSLAVAPRIRLVRSLPAVSPSVSRDVRGERRSALARVCFRLRLEPFPAPEETAGARDAPPETSPWLPLAPPEGVTWLAAGPSEWRVAAVPRRLKAPFPSRHLRSPDDARGVSRRARANTASRLPRAGFDPSHRSNPLRSASKPSSSCESVHATPGCPDPTADPLLGVLPL